MSLRLLLIWTLWLTVSTALAAELKPVTSLELKLALKKYQTMSSMDVDFKQTKTLRDMNFQLQSEGHLTVRPPDQVIWEIKKPMPLKVELNKDQITMGQSQMNTAQIPERQGQELTHVMSWLKMDADALVANYNVRKLNDLEYEFVSKDQESLFKSMRMRLNKLGHVEQILFSEISGDEMLLKFAKPEVKYEKAK